MHYNLSMREMLKCGVSAIALAPSLAFANPTGGVVVGGSAAIGGTGNALTVTQSSGRAIINWQDFDIGADEQVRFEQLSASSVTLNRVVGGGGGSQIDGQITANGNVFLVNPEGVMFGAGAQVNVGGLVATTADIDDDRFMEGNDRFDIAGNPNATVVNEGSISAAIDGLVALIAPKVENRGTVTAQLGKVELAAGDTFAVDIYGDGLIALDASEAVETLSVEQQGQIAANGGLVRLSMADVQHIQNGLINVDGSLQANTQAGNKGNIIINAGSQRVKANTNITAEGSQNEDGGSISIFGMEISLGGLLSADGKNGGEVTVKSGNSLSLAEDITAKGLNGNGGTISVHAGGRTIASSTSNIDASGTHAGGMVTAISDGHLLTSGRYAANGGTGKGGNVDVTANSIASLSAKFEASGTDGGRIRIGGEYQGGKNLTTDELKNAQAVMLNNGTKITAKGTSGNGGTAIVWSEQNTSVQGLMDLSPSAGNTGGFVEVSSADKVAFGADVITGQGGTFLLDPKNITIGEASGFDSDYAIFGKGYNGTLDFDVSALGGSDNFGISISLDGTRMAVGAYGDDGSGNTTSGSGAVYLFTFSDSSFNGATLEGIVGKGYTGGKNINVSTLGTFDAFGADVSLDGTRMAVGAFSDDGPANAATGSGAVYLFSFSDSSFTSGTLEATIGKGYTGGKNIDVSGLEAGDYFGTSVSLDGNRLAVGAMYDDGSGNSATYTGAIYLFSFSDSAFTGGTLEATLGKGYTGGKNVDVSTLEALDYFGWSVSLDSNRLAVGAYSDDGFANSSSDTGAVYLFSFSDSAFTGGALEATLGKGYTGGKNVDVSSLDNSDSFGIGVSLDGNRLAVGTYGDSGFGNSGSSNGAVYLFSFSDSTFSSGTIEATVGFGYTGGNNINISSLASNSLFGSSVSLDSNRLVVGAYGNYSADGAISEAGAAYLITFSDSDFNGGTHVGTFGKGYAPASNGNTNNFDVSATGIGDIFGASVSLDGTRMAVGATGDDGSSDSTSATGAVYLFSFSDTSFNGATLEATIGKGYTGGKNFDVSALEAGDQFGTAVALDGNRLAVSARNDDGSGNSASYTGAVYLFSFSDSTFTGGTLEATLGKGYSGGKNFDVSALETYDYFGRSVSLDGNRLAVGVSHDAGFGNTASYIGAVYLFSFSDSSFSGATLEATLGKGYTGGKNIDVSSLEASGFSGDNFGQAVSLEGNYLVVGAPGDRGFGNTTFEAGAVYLFSFSDSTFSGGTQESIIGKGYTGGKNVDVSALSNYDNFGSAVSLNGTRLAAGAQGDDGSSDTTNNSGAVYLFSFSDSSYTGGTIDLTLGKGYSGGSNIDVANLETGDTFGYSVSLDAGRLIVGAFSDDGPSNGTSGSGAVYLFTPNDSAVTDGDAYADNAASDITITPTSITTLLDAGTNVTLQASNDITVSGAVTANNTGGDGGDFTLQAGRSILLNASITTDNGDLFVYANDTAANGVVDGNRDAGNAVITMASGVTINAGTGAVSFELRDGSGNTNTGAGDITLRDITAGTIFVRNFNTGNDIVLTSGTLTASGVSDALQLVSAGDFINNVGGSVFSVASGDWLVYSTNPANDTIGGLTADFRRFTCAFGGSCPSFPSSGDGFLYSYTPTLTVTPSALSITAGDAVSLAGYSYNLSGYLDSDAGDDSITGTLNGTTSYTIASSAGTYNIDYNSGSLTSTLGYSFSYANNASALSALAPSGGGGSGGGGSVRDSLTTAQQNDVETVQNQQILATDEEAEESKELVSENASNDYCKGGGGGLFSFTASLCKMLAIASSGIRRAL